MARIGPRQAPLSLSEKQLLTALAGAKVPAPGVYDEDSSAELEVSLGANPERQGLPKVAVDKFLAEKLGMVIVLGSDPTAISNEFTYRLHTADGIRGVLGTPDLLTSTVFTRVEGDKLMILGERSKLNELVAKAKAKVTPEVGG